MGLRFRKSIKLMPGVRFNLSRSGISTSIGSRGASINVKRGRKARVSVNIPGTGISYSSTLSSRPSKTVLPERVQGHAPLPTRYYGLRVGKPFGAGIAALAGLLCFGSVTFGVILITIGAAIFFCSYD